jgi:hypothetical protein
MVAFVVSLFNISLAASPPQNAHRSDKKPAAGVTQKKEAGFLSTIGDSKFWLLGMAYFLTGFLILVPFTFLPTYAFQELHMSFQTASGFVTLIGIAA